MNHKTKAVASLWIFLTLVVALSSAILSVNSSPTTTFAVEPAHITGRAGESVTVDVECYEAFYLYSWQVRMAWDNETLEFDNVVYAGFLAGQPEGSTPYSNIRENFAILSEATNGDYAGISGDGLLCTVTFNILQESSVTIFIDHATLTYYVEVFVPPNLVKVENFNKENGYFEAVWLEDINVDGIIDIFDISSVGIDWGGCGIQTKSPSATSGAWSWGDHAYASDDLWASTTTASAEQVYSIYGFATTHWSSVTKVEVGLEAAIDAGGNNELEIYVSGDGGTYSSAIDAGVPPETEALYWVDVTAALSWTPSMLTDGNFLVKIKYIKVGGGSGAETIYVDWIPVRVTPEPMAVSPYTDISGDGVVDIVDLSYVAVKFGEMYAGF